MGKSNGCPHAEFQGGEAYLNQYVEAAGASLPAWEPNTRSQARHSRSTRGSWVATGRTTITVEAVMDNVG